MALLEIQAVGIFLLAMVAWVIVLREYYGIDLVAKWKEGLARVFRKEREEREAQ